MSPPSITAGGHSAASIDLFWLPLGAGGSFVRGNGRVFEAVVSRLAHRPACDLYHSALEVTVDGGRFVIEQTPVPDTHGTERGVVAEGAVGARWARGLRIFRYEIRRWNGGRIPDVDEAVDSPVRVSTDPSRARRLLDLVPHVPTLTWGRDELRTGDMWNSNSVVAWLIACVEIDAAAIPPPHAGRAPGWLAGLAAARVRAETAD
jgi:hypothetical protein